jgi:hypothetical protein
MNFWIKNTSGHPDAMLSLATLATLTVLGKVIVNGVFGTIDATIIAATLTPTLGAYVARRHLPEKKQ